MLNLSNKNVNNQIKILSLFLKHNNQNWFSHSYLVLDKS